MTVGSLFSGIGGLDRGFEAAGFEVRWMVERDPFCRRALERHWPGVPVYDDARMSIAAWRAVEPVDVIIGGFPCQDVSNAGLRRGLSGERSGLWWCIRRAARVVRPRYVVVENVFGLLVRGMPTVLGSLARIGFDAEWAVIRASDVGAPHRRARVFIVAYPQRDTRRDEQQRIERGPAGDGQEPNEAGARRVADSECAERRAVDVGLVDVGDGHDAGWAEATGRSSARGEALADPADDRREQRRPTHDDDRDHAPGNDAHGCGAGRVADAAIERGRRKRADGAVTGDGDQTLRSGPSEPGRCGSDLAHALEPTWRGELAALRADGRTDAWHGWPARPGERQHAYEPPRGIPSARRPLADTAGVSGSGGHGATDEHAAGSRGAAGGPLQADEGREVERAADGAQSAVGAAPDGIPSDLPGWRRAALRATGNAVVPQVAQVVAERVLEIERERH